MNDWRAILIAAAVLLVALPALTVVVIFSTRPTWAWVRRAVSHVWRCVVRELGDLVRIFGALLTSIALSLIAVLNLVLGRWSSAAHYGRAIRIELLAMVGCIYRVLIGNPARLLLLGGLTEGFETRIPAAIAHAPAGLLAELEAEPGRNPSFKKAQFVGYTIVGTLPGGGSGARLFIAEPSAAKLAALDREGQKDVQKVVIKSFSLSDGSTLPQIVRENRALPAAKRLGLILEHELTEDKFYYVTRYVPGESLVVTTNRLHARDALAEPAQADGLDGSGLKETLGYASDILRTLSRYHSGGLWHKDVKPDNIIVHDAKAELVDFGLVTPLRSSMTLTTHGTEYFRDPEMVRMALRGVRVHEVDGAKFDIYAAGAVLYSMIENSFPAHGGLSRISKKCPEALRWVVRRAMTDYDKRYETAAAMLADVETVAVAPDPFALRPADLPSVIADRESGIEPSSRVLPISTPDAEEVGGPRVGPGVRTALAMAEQPEFPHPEAAEDGPVPALLSGAALASAGAAGASASGQSWLGSAAIDVENWWSGRYAVKPGSPDVGGLPGFATAEALGDAREEMKAARHGRPARLRNRAGRPKLNLPARVAILIGAVALAANLGWFTKNSSGRTRLDQAVSAVRQTFGLRPDSDGSLGKILVLCDRAGLDAAGQRRVNDQLDRLSRAGFDLVGTTVPAESSEKAADEAESINDLRTQIGDHSFRSEEAAAAIRAWLDDRDDLAMVVWIHHAGSGTQPDGWVVARSGASDQAVRAASRALGASSSRG